MNYKHPKLNEKGFASIVIALVLIIVLALLTVGFAQLARREQQSALDKQLADQANYAAESGINAAYRDIKANKITADGAAPGTFKADNQNCMHAPAGYTGLTANQSVNSNNGVLYTCLLVDLQPPNLQFGNVSPGSGRHMNFGTQDSLSSLTVYWGSASGHNSNFPGSTGTNLPPWNTWSGNHYPAVIQFSITPVGGLGTQPGPTQYLINNTFNVYLYPASSGGHSVAFDPNNQGQKVSGDCDPSTPNPAGAPAAADYPCKVTINGLSGQSFVIHFVDYYDTSNIYATGVTVSGAPAQFSGEPLIDVTGKARNVLKRLQERLLLNGGNNGPNDNAILPNGAIEAQNICKRIQAAPPTADYAQGSTYDTGISSTCNLSN